MAGPVRNPSQPLHWQDLRWPVRLLVVAFCTVLCGLCVEGICRAYWTAAKGVPFFRMDRIWDRFYFPELAESNVSAAPESRDDDTYDVLLLGGSVLYPSFGDVGKRLQKRLAEHLDRKVKVCNLSYPGRTSLDTLIKYQHIDRKRFDLVLLYDNINDVFLNNVPPELYRDDYRHATRFEQLAEFDRHPEVALLAAPFTLWYLPNNYLDKMNLSSRPRREWHHHGSDIRTPHAFAANLEKVLGIAARRGDPVLLLTFAYHLSDQEMAAAMLDGTQASGTPPPVAWWGSPSNVVRTLDAHNDVIRQAARRHPEAAFVDQQQIMPADEHFYTDLCHLNPAGCERFVENLLDHVDWEKMPGAVGPIHRAARDQACAKR